MGEPIKPGKKSCQPISDVNGDGKIDNWCHTTDSKGDGKVDVVTGQDEIDFGSGNVASRGSCNGVTEKNAPDVSHYCYSGKDASFYFTPVLPLKVGDNIASEDGFAAGPIQAFQISFKIVTDGGKGPEDWPMVFDVYAIVQGGQKVFIRTSQKLD